MFYVKEGKADLRDGSQAGGQGRAGGRTSGSEEQPDLSTDELGEPQPTEPCTKDASFFNETKSGTRHY